MGVSFSPPNGIMSNIQNITFPPPLEGQTHWELRHFSLKSGASDSVLMIKVPCPHKNLAATGTQRNGVKCENCPAKVSGFANFADAIRAFIAKFGFALSAKVIRL